MAFIPVECPPDGGGGGGGGVQNPCDCQFEVTNFPETQDVNVVQSVPLNVNVQNFPADSDFDIEETLLCDDNGTFIHRSVYNAETGAFVSATNTDLDGNPYVPVGTVKSCSESACCPVKVAEVCLSNGNQGVVIRNADETLLYFDIETGLPFNPATDVVQCVTTVSSPDEVIDNTIQRQVGVGSIVIAAGAKSITVTVITGVSNVTIGADPVVAVPAGVSLTWGVDDSNQSLLNAHTFAGVAGSDFIVTTTR